MDMIESNHRVSLTLELNWDGLAVRGKKAAIESWEEQRGEAEGRKKRKKERKGRGKWREKKGVRKRKGHEHSKFKLKTRRVSQKKKRQKETANNICFLFLAYFMNSMPDLWSCSSGLNKCMCIYIYIYGPLVHSICLLVLRAALTFLFCLVSRWGSPQAQWMSFSLINACL